MKLHVVVDPATLVPPSDPELKRWTRQLDSIAELLSFEPINGTCPLELRNHVLAETASRDHGIGPVSPWELVRMVDEVAARLRPELVCEEGTAIVDEVTVTPSYCGADGEAKTAFEEHLGSAAWVKVAASSPVNVLGPDESWAGRADAILVEGRLLMQDHPLHGDMEPEEPTVRAHLPRCDSPDAVLEHLADHPCGLMDHIELGVRVYWCSRFGGRPDELNFELGPDFAASVARMNYPRDARYAKSCLEAMALVAGGRADEVKHHAQREGRGGNEAALRHSSGRPVLRGMLAERTPNAHRIWWVRGRVPLFLNVGGHEDTPSL